jgi:glycolate oxidase iron-sulfur subunit
MKTSFTPDQLARPDIAEIDQILRKCVHCGFCTATCPTFVLTRDELDSPRGRIYLIKEMFENDRAADRETVKHIDRCLTCLSCMTTCPSGVDYMHLVEHARSHIAETAERSTVDITLRKLVAAILPYRRRVRAALIAGFYARPFASVVGLIPKVGKPLKAMLKLTGGQLPPRRAADRAGVFKPATPPAVRRRVLMLQGCVQPVLRPSINEAAIRLLNKAGVEVVQIAGEGCCGALVHHIGEEQAAREQAAHNIGLWWRETKEGGGEGLDAILITASGCGTSVKDYGHLFAGTPIETQAKVIAALARDVSEYALTLDLPAPTTPRGLRVAYHAACSMQHGQKIVAQPKALLRAAGYEVVDVAEGHLCCGSAGVYNILQPDLANGLKARKKGNIALTNAAWVATGNIGCIAQLTGGGAPVVHTVELLDWAHGGPAPET